MNTISLDDELALLHERICPALDHPVRMKIIYLLNEKAMNVGELTEVMGIPQSSVSRHLRVLREAVLDDSEKRGTWVYYRVVPAALQAVADVLTPGRRA